MLAERRRAHLLVIDVQEKLAPHISGGERVVRNCARLVRYARRLGVPVTLTEHYPKGLGGTAAEVREAAGNDCMRMEKINFSCYRDPAIRSRLDTFERQGRDQIVVAGMEAHVCVGQSVLDLRANQKWVMLVADAIGSRDESARDVAVERMRWAGAQIVTQEMLAFEWLGRGDDVSFKDMIALIKQE